VQQHVSPAELDYIEWAMGRGDTLTAISKHLDRSRNTITRHARELGLSWRGKRESRLTARQFVRVIEMVPVIGITATGRKLRIHPTVVCRLAKRFGVKSPWTWGGSRHA
jgi:transposase